MLIRSPSHPGKSVSPAPYTVTWELSENVALWSAQPTSQDRHSDKLPRETAFMLEKRRLDVSEGRGEQGEL